MLLRSIGAFESVEDLRNLIVRAGEPLPEGGVSAPVYLSNIAAVNEELEEVFALVRVNGVPGIRLAVTKQSDANTIEVAERVRAELERLNEEYRGQFALGVTFDSSEFIQAAIANVQESAAWGAALAVAVLLFFLRSMRSTLIISTAIPISVIGTFTLMYMADITLNIVSFGGIALGIGMLVDNSIVILENIYRHHENGVPATQAAIIGAREVAAPVISSTLTTLAVFLPVIFLGGFASVFFKQMAFVVTFTLLCSLLVALTLVPVLTALALKGRKPRPHGIIGGCDRLDRGYSRAVALPCGWNIAVLVSPDCSLPARLFKEVEREFMPPDDQAVRLSLKCRRARA
jgi:HAE1 family hydrophobic/amphiphilic exporter-1